IFTPPDDMKEEGKYMLVFQGVLGNEDGAVVGKQVELKELNTFFLITYGGQLVFEYEIDENKYKIEPIEKVVPLEGDSSGYKTWTVVTHPDNTNHFITWPTSYQYLNYIEHYGIKTGTDYLWRPEGFDEGSEYILETTWGYKTEPDYTPSAFGRHNYTLDNEGKMVSYDESLWAKATDNGCSNLDYVYRYRDEQSGDNFVDGEVIASNQLGEGSSVYIPGQGYTRCSGPQVDNNMIAAMGDNKAIYIEYQYWPNEGSSIITERDLEWSLNCDYVRCGKVYPDYKYRYLYGNKKGKFWLNRGNYTNGSKKRVSLNIAGEEIESIEFYPRTSEVETHFNAGGGWEYTASGSVGGEAPSDCPGRSCTVSEPGPFSFIALIESGSREDADILVHDFDNVPEDDSFIIIYSEYKAVSIFDTTTIEVECTLRCLSDYSASEYDPPPFEECHEIGRTVDDPSSNTTNKYYVAYKILGTATKKEILYSESVTGESVYNKILTGFSTQMNKEIMVYTYIMKQWNGTEYEFDKRVVGIINVSDSRLEEGYRQEYIIDEENFSIENFDYTQPSGIGIHKY
ncbi:hypothetical protein KY366_05945, partial [Candidatus Woesearchaeota archaeon]|nr:hypothetical protein [Candidatus Woesearchaeota archaeon]